MLPQFAVTCVDHEMPAGTHGRMYPDCSAGHQTQQRRPLASSISQQTPEPIPGARDTTPRGLA